MIAVVALALMALATNLTITVGGMVTLEPGRDPGNAARADCQVGYEHGTTSEPVRIEMCCQATCRAYCAKDMPCSSVCSQRCSRTA